MIHPATELRHVSPTIGHGVFATEPIPRGTLVYVRDSLEIAVTPPDFAALDPALRAAVDRFSYIDEHGVRVVSWDHGKYVNHRCDCNTMSTGYGFEIAIADIAAGDEITDEYGLFNLEDEFPVSCGCTACRQVVRPDDLDRYGAVWDRKVRRALAALRKVPQPLWDLVDPATRHQVTGYLDGERPYRSVACLKYEPGVHLHPRPGRRGARSRSVAA
ncbi:MAG: SET domain-containing protein [Candidatus Krumholzibacteriia bacterium]